MLQIMCMVDSEDYWNLNSYNEADKIVNYYGYTFNVEGSPDGKGKDIVRLIVIEFADSKMAVGFVTPNNLELDKELRIKFIANDSPTKDVQVDCKLSDEVKKAAYNGDELEKIEYIGYTLEKFYDNNNVKFYLHDLRPQTQGQQEQP